MFIFNGLTVILSNDSTPQTYIGTFILIGSLLFTFICNRLLSFVIEYFVVLQKLKTS